MSMPPSPRLDKGKGRQTLDSLLDEAISTPVSLQPIAPLPQAHYPSSMTGLGRPRLVSQLTRSTMPTASLAYASDGSRIVSETKSHRRSPSALIDPYPDLDPSTGLPMGTEEIKELDPRLHLQRTITGVLATKSESDGLSAYLPAMPNLSSLSLSLPKIPSLPSIPIKRPSLDIPSLTRSISTSAPQADWRSWASGLWNGNKRKVDSMMSEEDQADTIEEEQENLRRKCELKMSKADQTVPLNTHWSFVMDYSASTL